MVVVQHGRADLLAHLQDQPQLAVHMAGSKSAPYTSIFVGKVDIARPDAISATVCSAFQLHNHSSWLSLCLFCINLHHCCINLPLLATPSASMCTTPVEYAGRMALALPLAQHRGAVTH